MTSPRPPEPPPAVGSPAGVGLGPHAPEEGGVGAPAGMGSPAGVGLGSTVIVHAPRDVLLLEGPDAREYLQGQCTQDVSSLAPGGAVDAFLLEPTGKVDALIRVLCTGEERFAVDVDAGFGTAVAERLARFKLRSRFTITEPGWAVVALRGPEAERTIRDAESRVPLGDVHVVPWSWGGVTGVDLLGPVPERWLAAALPSTAGVGVGPHAAEEGGVGPPPGVGSPAWEPVRIRAGVPVMGREIDERTIPAETGLLERCVSLTKGCYTGQELVARMDARGNRAPRHLRGLLGELGAAELEPGALVGADLAPVGAGADDRPVGQVTSAAWSPEDRRVVALGYVHRSVALGTLVTVLAPGGQLSATVVDLPIR